MTTELFENAEGASPAPRRRKAVVDVMPIVVDLTEAAIWGQRERVATFARSLIDELGASRPAVARRLQRRLPEELKPLSLKQSDLVALFSPRFGLDAVVLPDAARQSVEGMLAEHGERERLRTFGLHPRHRLLLHGPPGNGKSMLAEAVARDLDVPFARVRYGGIVDSYLGGTAKNIDSLLDVVNVAPCVLFVDEFDGVGVRRDHGNDVGEMRRVTNHLLLFLDQLPAHCVFIAATNEYELIDKALLRRFDTTVELTAPDRNLRYTCAARALSPTLTPGFDISDRAAAVADLPLENLDAVVKLCERLRRDLVLNSGNGLDSIIATTAELAS